MDFKNIYSRYFPSRIHFELFLVPAGCQFVSNQVTLSSAPLRLLLLGSACGRPRGPTASPGFQEAGGKPDTAAPSSLLLYKAAKRDKVGQHSRDHQFPFIDLIQVVLENPTLSAGTAASRCTWLCSRVASLACCVSRVSGSRWYRDDELCFLLASLYFA